MYLLSKTCVNLYMYCKSKHDSYNNLINKCKLIVIYINLEL